MRRAGKSTLLLQLISSHFKWNEIYYFNFEDERLINFTVQDFNYLYETMIELYGLKKIFFFDEIQNVPEWERFVRRLSDEKIKFIITGSNASLLSKELGTKLTGRYVQVELLPYSFKEFLSYHKINYTENSYAITTERAIIKKYFNEYLLNGGIPEYITYQSPELLIMLYENIIYKDILVRYEVHDVRAFRELARYLMSNIGTLISYSKLKHILNLGSVNTVKNYLHYLENSYLILTIESYAYSVLKQTISQKKIYVIDTGLANKVGIQFSPNTGKYLENIVFLELRQRFTHIYYYKTANQLEVDFLVLENKKVQLLIQVCETLTNEKTRQREINALKTAMIELNLSKAILLTLDESEEIHLGPKQIIVILPVYQWLLSEFKDMMPI